MSEAGATARVPVFQPTAGQAQPRPVALARALTRRLDGALLIVIAFSALVGFWRLESYPRTWFDEGIHLQVAKNLVADGTYASVSADGTRDYAPAIGVGPTVMLPVSGAIWLGGVDLTSARVVQVLFLIAATSAMYRVSRALFDVRVALLTVALLLTLPALDWVATGRQLLGETPALLFLLAGGWLALRSSSKGAAIAGGAVLGLAMVTKGQYVLIVPLATGAVALLDRRGQRTRPLAWYALLLSAALAIWAGWMAALVLTIADGEVVENVRLLRESSGGALIVFDAGRMLAAAKLLLGPGTFLIALPAVVSGWLAARRSGEERRPALVALWVFQAVWLLWFTFASIGWPRYAFPALAINCIFAADLLVRAADWARAHLRSMSIRPALRTATHVTLILGCVAIGCVAAVRELRPVFVAGGDDAQQFAALVDARVPAGVAIDAWEPELGFLSDAAFQYPPPGSLDRAVRARWLGDRLDTDLSAGLTADYLVVGSFGRWAGTYAEALASSRYELLERLGEYELYRRVP